MKEISLKRGKYLVVIKVPHDIPGDVMYKMKEELLKYVPDLAVMMTQGETEITVLKLED